MRVSVSPHTYRVAIHQTLETAQGANGHVKESNRTSYPLKYLKEID